MLAVSTLASGRPLEADGWSRPWVVIGFYAVFWWLRDRAQARRFAMVMVAAGTVAALYGILQHFTGVDWWRAALGRPTRVRPRIAGAEVFDRLRALRPDIPVLLMSGYSVDHESEALLSRGAVGFLQKPFTVRDLVGRIDECVAARAVRVS